MATNLRVLLLAEAANPEWSSVPLVGYSLAEAMRKVADVHVVTHVRNRDALKRVGWREGVDFTPIDTEFVAAPAYRVQDKVREITGVGPTFTQFVCSMIYYAFEELVWREFGSRIERGEFDLVHRVTPLSPTAQSRIASRCRKHGVPFVLGPLNGGVPWPAAFRDAQHREGEWLAYVRDLYKVLPGYGSTRRAASAIVVGSKATYDELPSTDRHRGVYVPENAIDPARFSLRKTSAASVNPLKVAWVGRMVAYKGADMLLEAAAPMIARGEVVLDLIGDGPERESLIAQAARLGVAHGVRMDGWVEHRELQHRLCESDVFAFPSVREFGGGVVLEAMALGLLPIVADYAGPAELVTEATGIRVPLGTRSDLVTGFRSALARVRANPERIRVIGDAARERVFRSFTWDAKAGHMLDVYEFALGRASKPDYGMPFA